MSCHVMLASPTVVNVTFTLKASSLLGHDFSFAELDLTLDQGTSLPLPLLLLPLPPSSSLRCLSYGSEGGDR